MNPDDLIINTDYSGVTVSVDDYWSDMSDPRDEDQEAFKSINDRLSTIESRLSILVPDKDMLEKYEVLQDMYNNTRPQKYYFLVLNRRLYEKY
jgi:hypothetical protein